MNVNLDQSIQTHQQELAQTELNILDLRKQIKTLKIRSHEVRGILAALTNVKQMQDKMAQQAAVNKDAVVSVQDGKPVTNGATPPPDAEPAALPATTQ